MPNNNQGKSKRGFASMDEDKQREAASRGGQQSGGNFANDPERASEAGRKGGQQSGGNRDQQQSSDQSGQGAVSRVRAAWKTTTTSRPVAVAAISLMIPRKPPKPAAKVVGPSP